MCWGLREVQRGASVCSRSRTHDPEETFIWLLPRPYTRLPQVFTAGDAQQLEKHCGRHPAKWAPHPHRSLHPINVFHVSVQLKTKALRDSSPESIKKTQVCLLCLSICTLCMKIVSTSKYLNVNSVQSGFSLIFNTYSDHMFIFHTCTCKCTCFELLL